MFRFLPSVLLVFCSVTLGVTSFAQSETDMRLNQSISGSLLDSEGEPVSFANVLLQLATDSSIRKVEVSDIDGIFLFTQIEAGDYFLTAKYIGLPDFTSPPFALGFGESKKMGQLSLKPASIELETATVTAQRSIVEIKSDRTVFNVDGTINSAGGDALTLLRKAPGVMLDNNDNISVLGRAGVLVYIDGKRSPLGDDALTAYLQSLPAEQIDRIDIITNPGAKYEAEGNAGIIDIRLKKNENWGTNGSASLSAAQGKTLRSNASLTLNHREGKWNHYLTGGVYRGANVNTNFFNTSQESLFIREDVRGEGNWQGGNLKIGTDYFLNDKHTLGVMFNGNYNDRFWESNSRALFAPLATPTYFFEILQASNTDNGENINASGNFNYRYDNKNGETINVDVDYGRYSSESEAMQPNLYFEADGVTPTRRIVNAFDTPSDIDIYTGQFDYERTLGTGKFSTGAKFTKVVSDNTFRFFDVIGGESTLNDNRSNLFLYDEQVEAGYVTYSTSFGPANPAGQGKRFTVTGGVRVEHTQSTGDLTVFGSATPQPPLNLDYWNVFPNAGLTWAAAPKHSFALNYGRRINRPDYQVLNPFENKLSEISFEKGNPFLLPEIVNNIELAHTFAYRYTTKLSYSRTTDQITRLLFADSTVAGGGFITWENLASQSLLSLNVSVPADINKWWNVYFTATGTYQDNQGFYEDGSPEGSTIDLQAFNFNMYNQHTFKLPGSLSFEVSGWFSGPGIWGGNFKTKAMGALNLGVQRKFMNDKLRVRVGADDILFTSGWRGSSDFGGQFLSGGGNWDSRRVSLSLNYNFGNEKVKGRKRKTAIEDAAGRVGGEG